MTLHERFNPDNRPSPVAVPQFSRTGLAALFAEFGFTKGAEIGVLTGEYSEILCQQNPGLALLLCIDSWTESRRNTYWKKEPDGPEAIHAYHCRRAHERLAPYPAVAIMKMTSMDAAAQVPDRSLDFVYIDAEHRFGACMEDLTVWSRKVRSGGIIAGDDYRRGPRSTPGSQIKGVIRAVETFVREQDIHEFFMTSDKSRQQEMPDGTILELTGTLPSFFWHNP